MSYLTFFVYTGAASCSTSHIYSDEPTTITKFSVATEGFWMVSNEYFLENCTALTCVFGVDMPYVGSEEN